MVVVHAQYISHSGNTALSGSTPGASYMTAHGVAAEGPSGNVRRARRAHVGLAKKLRHLYLTKRRAIHINAQMNSLLFRKTLPWCQQQNRDDRVQIDRNS